jgi:hypothetical protein
MPRSGDIIEYLNVESKCHHYVVEGTLFLYFIPWIFIHGYNNVNPTDF